MLRASTTILMLPNPHCGRNSGPVRQEVSIAHAVEWVAARLANRQACAQRYARESGWRRINLASKDAYA
jgi:hypothetical protein